MALTIKNPEADRPAWELASLTGESIAQAIIWLWKTGFGGLNFDDCFAYALAKATGEPLLSKGTVFAATEIKVVGRPPIS